MKKRNPIDLEEMQIAPISQLLLTIPQTAAVLTIGQSSVYELIEKDGLPYVSINGVKRVSLVGLQTWISQRQCSSQEALQQQLRTGTMERGEKPVSTTRGYQRRTPVTKARKNAS